MAKTQPTPEQLKQYIDDMVEAVLTGADIDVNQLPVANGVALQQIADELNTAPSDETVGRLRAALLILAGASTLDAMQELLDVARSSSPSAPAVPGGLSGLLGNLGVPNLPPTASASAQAAPAAPDPATDPAAAPPRSRRRAPRNAPKA